MATKTEIVFTLIIFFSLVSTIMGFIGNDLQQQIEEEEGILTYTTDTLGLKNTIFGDVVFGYSSLPTWINVVFFGGISILIAWLIISSLPTVSGGS